MGAKAQSEPRAPLCIPLVVLDLVDINLQLAGLLVLFSSRQGGAWNGHVHDAWVGVTPRYVRWTERSGL